MSSVLFLGTGNACRSQMAEAIARRLLPPDLVVLSAGTEPKPVHPRAMDVLRELDIDASSQRSKSIDEIRLDSVDRVITLSDDAAERCPVAPDMRREHWPLRDPAAATGPADEVLANFRSVRNELLHQVRRLAARLPAEPALGIIGGSGFYDLPGLTEVRRIDVETPFGAPSAPLLTGRFNGKRIVFLARHGEGHRLLPGEINTRANICALKRLGVTRLVSVSAVGSLREEIAPGQVILPRQFIDRTVSRPATFFGSGVVAHVSLADPVCATLADTLEDSARTLDIGVHGTGTYLCIEGPQFSTRAESALWRSWGSDIVGMTNLPEARLAREAELCYATLALPTDYDCWRTRADEVRVADVLSVMRANVEKARRILARAIDRLDPASPCTCRNALGTALLTPPTAIGEAALLRLHSLLARILEGEQSAGTEVSI